MKRPSGLPPAKQAAQPNGDSVVDDEESGESKQRGSILPFRIGRSSRTSDVRGESSEDGAPAIASTSKLDQAADSDGGLLSVWRAARARRKSLRAEVRRFTARSRRRRIIGAVVAGAILLLVVGSFGAAYSPLFAVQRIEVVGTKQLDADRVAEALSDQIGRPLPTVNRAEVNEALKAFPLIQTYTLEAMPPHKLILRISERTAIGYIVTGSSFTTVDAAGVEMDSASAAPAGLPKIAVPGVTTEAFAAVGTVLRAIPPVLRAEVVSATASSPENVSFVLKSGPTVFWGSADDSGEKVVTLTAALDALPPGSVGTFDVSAPSHLVVR